MTGRVPLLWSISRSTRSAFFPETIIPSSLQAAFKSLTFSSSNRMEVTWNWFGCSTGTTWGTFAGRVPETLLVAPPLDELGALFFARESTISGSFCMSTPLGYCCCKTCSWRNSCCCCRTRLYGVSWLGGGLEFVFPPFALFLLGGTYS